MPNTVNKWKDHRESVQVDSCEADVNEIAWTTLRWLNKDSPEGGSDQQAIDLFKICMKELPPANVIYVNPIARVVAPQVTAAFLSEARRQQRKWINQINSWLFSAARVKRHYDATHPITRQLEFTGVLIVHGRHVRPDQWPACDFASSNRPLTGMKFGFLTVIEDLPQQLCRCECQCGNTTIKKRKHLLSGRTTSCGCRRDQANKINRERKDKRVWLHSGEIRSKNQ